MGKAYYIQDANSLTYYGTCREALDAQRMMEEPERVQRVDAADELNRYMAEVRALESRNVALACALKNLVSCCDPDLLDTHDGRVALKLAIEVDPDYLDGFDIDYRTVLARVAGREG